VNTVAIFTENFEIAKNIRGPGEDKTKKNVKSKTC
jgi:hypothetical protein